MKAFIAFVAITLASVFAFAVPAANKSHALVQSYMYDFAVDGGAVGFKDLSAKVRNTLPTGAVVKSVYYHVVTAPTSGGSATIAIGDGETGTRYLTGTAFDNAAYAGNNVAAVSSGIPNRIAGTNENNFGITIATAALTAGKIKFWVEYYY